MRGDHDDLDDLEKAMDEAIEANDIDQHIYRRKKVS
jgi:hypothetical protein